METTLNVQTRAKSGKGAARSLRRAGRVPGVVYGGAAAPILVSAEAAEAWRLFNAISVENTILHLVVDGGEAERTLVREIQTHPYLPQLLHVDFLRVQRGKPIEVQVPISLQGMPEGVRTEGGVLDLVVHDLAVKCVPSKIPEVIAVDVSALNIGDVLRAGDLEMPEGVENLVDPARTICSVAPPRVIAEDETPEEGEAEAGPGPAEGARESSEDAG